MVFSFTSSLKALLSVFGLEIRRFRPGSNRSFNRSNFGEQEILEKLIRDIPSLPASCVDIGAGDGILHSNSLALFERGFQGIALEWNGARFGRLAWKHKDQSHIRLARIKVTPLNIVSLLHGLDLPHEFGVLSLDLDGYDYFVLEAILGSFSPGILCVEINEKIPPPLHFTVLWHEDYSWKEDHFYGQSLSQAYALAEAKGYALVMLEYNNAFFVRNDLNPWPRLNPLQAYQKGYLDRPDRLTRLPWNRDMEDLQTLSPEKAIARLHQKFAAYAGHYSLKS